MVSFSSSDTIFASAYQRGREIFNTCGSGFNSMADIVSRLRSGGVAPGMVTLTVRNASQGWSHTGALYFAAM